MEAFRAGLRELGYTGTRTPEFEFRSAKGKVGELPALAASLVQARVDVIFTTWGTAAPLAVKQATTTIPVVFGAVGDPVKAEIVQSLAKPGANITGLSSLTLELEGKRIAILKEIVPKAVRIGVFFDPGSVYSSLALKEEQKTAAALGVTLRPVVLRGSADLEKAFEDLKKNRVEALSLHGYGATLSNRAAIVAFAVANRIPAIYPVREYVTEGGLASYGANLVDISRRAAHYVDRILRGSKPGELPVEQPTTLEFTINLSAAKALGITIPQSVLLRADRVIE